MVIRYAVIPTYNRPTELARCIESLVSQVQRIVVVDNGSMPPVSHRTIVQNLEEPAILDVLPCTIIAAGRIRPPNLSRLWNVGLEFVRKIVQPVTREWDVAILNDDAIVPEGWFEAVGYTMRDQGAAAGCSCDFRPPGTLYHFGPDAPANQHTRLTGWAFMLRGELGLRFDEQFQWWCGDDDMSMQARRNGGLIQIGGYPVQNTLANTTTTGELLAQSAVDMQRFVDKWGVRPW